MGRAFLMAPVIYALAGYDIRLYFLNIIDSLSILDGDGGINAMGAKRLDVRLNTGAS